MEADTDQLRVVDFLELCDESKDFCTSFDEADTAIMDKCFTSWFELIQGLDLQRVVDRFKRFTELLREISDVIELDPRVSFLDMATYFLHEGYLSIYYDLVNERFVFYSVPKGPAKTSPVVNGVSENRQLRILYQVWEFISNPNGEVCMKRVRKLKRLLQAHTRFYQIVLLGVAYYNVCLGQPLKQNISAKFIKLMKQARNDVEHLEPCLILIVTRLNLAIVGQFLYRRTGDKKYILEAKHDADVGLQAMSTDESFMNNDRVNTLVKFWKPEQSMKENVALD